MNNMNIPKGVVPEESDASNKVRTFDDILNSNILESQLPESAELSFGKGQDFNDSKKDIARYISFGSETFGNHGYDPTRDNSTLYNANTHWSKDLSRAYTGMLKLAGVGARDTFAFGVTQNKETAHKDFEKIMNTYGSTRGGNAGFIANTGLSAGYTVGIMGAIAAEEIAIGLTTGGLGWLSAPAEAGRGVFLASRGLEKADAFIAGYGNIARGMKKMSDIKVARAAKGGGDSWMKAFGKQLMPMGETGAFLRGTDALSAMNKYQHAFMGAASLAKDARKVHMTMAESRLEANMKSDEVRTELYSDWYKNNEGEMPDDVRADFNKQSMDVYRNVYTANAGLIYVTNAITFNSMFRSMRLTNTMFGLSQAGKFSVSGLKKAGQDILVEAVHGGVKNWSKKQLSQLSYKSVAKWALTSSMEGFQEVGQDLISSAAEKYVLGDKKLQGSYFDSLYASLGDMQLHSFASGMLMGTFASPVGLAISQTNKFVLGGGSNAVFNRGKYESEKAKQRNKADEMASVLTAYLRETGTYLDEAGKPVFELAKAEARMVEAAKSNDRKYFEDNRAEAYRIGMHKIIEAGLEKEFIKHLKSLSGYTAAELNEFAQRQDITEDNKGEFLDKVNKKISAIKSYKKNYDAAQTEVNPINLQLLQADDPELNVKRRIHRAFEDLRRESVFNMEKLDDYKSRMDGLSTAMTKDNSITSTELMTLLDEKSLDEEIQSLQFSVNANKSYDVNKGDMFFDQLRLDSLKAYKKALRTYKGLDESGPIPAIEKVHSDMFEAFNGLINSRKGVKETPQSRVMNRRKFDQFWDYLNMGAEREELQSYVNTMMDPTFAGEALSKQNEALKLLEDNMEVHIKESLQAFIDNKDANIVLDELLKENMFFNNDEVDDLIKKGIMPSAFFDSKTHERLKGDKLRQAQEIVANRIKNLTGKTIISTEKAFVSRNKNPKDKRRVVGLAQKFGGKEDGKGRRKLDVPTSISEFIDTLLQSRYLTSTEKEILYKLKQSGLTKGNVILTDSNDAPIGISENGDVIIDVRFSAHDYEGGNTPFEYLAISALLQSHYAEKLKTDENLKEEVTSLMIQARDAYFERNKEDWETKEDLDVLGFFSDPVQFLSESLNNLTFQNFLADVEDATETGRVSVWKTFTNKLKLILKKLDFSGTILNRALALSQLALKEENIEKLTNSKPLSEEEMESGTVDKTEDEEVKKPEVSPVSQAESKEGLELKIDELKAKKKELQDAKDATPRIKFTIKRTLKTEILEINDEIKKLEFEYKEKYIDNESDKPLVEPSPGKGSTKSVDSSSDGTVSVNERTLFKDMNPSLQEALADHYLRNDKEANFIGPMPEKLSDRAEEGKVDGVYSAVKQLSFADIKAIEGLLGKLTYLDIIAEHNKNNGKPKIEDVEDVEEVEKSDREKYPWLKKVRTMSDLARFIPRIEEVYTDAELSSQVNRMNTRDTIKLFKEWIDEQRKEVAKRVAELPVAEAEEESTEMRNNRIAGIIMPQFLGSFTVMPNIALNKEDFEYFKANEEEIVALAESLAMDLVDSESDSEVEEEYEFTEEWMKESFPGIADVFTERQMANRLKKIQAQTNKEDLLDVIKKILRDVAKSKVKKASGTKAELEAKRKQAYANFQLITPGSKLYKNEKDKKGITINKDNSALIKELLPKIFYLPKEQFEAKVLEYISNSKNIASSIKNSAFSLNYENDTELWAAIIRKKNELIKNKTLSSFTLVALNNYLDKIKSPYTIKKLKGDYLVVKRSGVLAKSKKGETIDDRFWSDYIYTLDQARFRVYKWLSTKGSDGKYNKVNPSALSNPSEAELKTFVSSKSQNMSADGIADSAGTKRDGIFDNDELAAISRLDSEGMNIVLEMIDDFNSLSEMRGYFVKQMKSEDKSMQDDMDAEEANFRREEEIANARIQQSILDLNEFEGSDTYKILSGVFSGSRSDLNDSDKKLYDEYYTEQDSFDTILNNRSKNKTYVEKASEEFASSLFEDSVDQSNSTTVNNILARVKPGKATLVEIIAANNYIKDNITLSNSQISRVRKALEIAILSPNYYGEVVVNKDGELLQIQDFPGNKVVTQFDNRRENKTQTASEFIDSVAEVLEDGTIFKKLDIDTNIDNEGFEDLQVGYSEIFGNLAESMAEISNMSNTLSEKQLNEDILEVISKCKK